MKFQIITIFPEIFNSYFGESIIKRAQNKNLIELKIHNLRDWTTDKHKTVDDAPYGGGAGMLMKIEPLYKALKEINKKSAKARGVGTKIKPTKRKIILLSASGKKWNQKLAQKYSKLEEVVFICGRYEGVDARIKKFIDEEVSIGEYVLTGGELPTMVIIDSITRLLPGVLGNKASAIEESHSEEGLAEYPQYTRPEIFEVGGKKLRVPKILLSGNHKKIEEWRKGRQKKIK